MLYTGWKKSTIPNKKKKLKYLMLKYFNIFVLYLMYAALDYHFGTETVSWHEL